ncbi:hypothetical protein HN51_025992 [Arachis hypogaea]|nr:uncharacterized protein LOC114924282 [Arachis hypogaea]
MDGGDFSQCIDVMLRPPTGVNFVTLEMVVTGHIFARDLYLKEIFIPNDHCQGDREALWTLRPGEEVVDDVLNLLVSMLTSERGDKRIWWLPTTFVVSVNSAQSLSHVY